MSHLESEGAGGFPVELCRWTSSGSSRVRRGYRAVDEKRRTGEQPHLAANNVHDDDVPLLVGETSPGVKRMEVLAAHITTVDKAFIMVCLFLIAFVYSLDGTLRYVYQVCFDSFIPKLLPLSGRRHFTRC